MRLSAYALALTLASGGGAYAVDQPLYQPEPAWVHPVPIPFDMKPSGAAADVLRFSVQDRLAPGDDEAFEERAVRINASEGLQQAGSLIQAWNPLTDTLILHRARILRAGKVIDLLGQGRRFAVLRRETSLEAAMIDGELTATLQPEGLQVGDVLDYAFTLVRREAALAGHSEAAAVIAHAGTIGRLVVQASWPADRPFHTWKTDDLPQLSPVTHAGWTEVGFDRTEDVSPEPPKGASLQDRLFGLLQVGDFKDWNQVSATAYPLYDKAATLSAQSPLRAEIARIRAASVSPKARALAALKLVENQTRYLLVGLDAGGYTPAAADLTWTRRFGDCKGKTVLLLALLRGLDISAEPALVHTVAGEALDRRLPVMEAFNHVIVRVQIDGRTYWLDGTRMGDENLDVIPVPNDHWALPLRPQGADLVPLELRPPVLPYLDTVVKVDARGGLDHPAAVHEELIMRGDLALYFNLAIKQVSQLDADRALRRTLTSDRSWLRPDKVSFTYDPQTLEGRAILDGSGAPPFTSAGGGDKGARDWLIEGASVGYDADLTRTSDYHRNAAYEVNYPAYTRTLVEVRLPDDGKGFETFNGETVNRTAAGIAYSRTASIANGVFAMVASSRAVAPSFPVAEAAGAEASLRSLDGYDVSLRYTPAAATAVAAEPAVTAASFDPAAHGAIAFDREDYAAADADFTAALAKGKTAKLYYDRGAVRAALGKLDLAQADLNAAILLDPRDAFPVFALGRIALRRGDTAEAARRFAIAQADSAVPAQMAGSISTAYEEAGRYQDASAYNDKVVAALSATGPKAQALNNGCWLRAEAGADLQRALQDCDASLELVPGAADVLDSRGLVDLRLGAFDKAVADYSAALIKQPGLATSLYGRAFAEHRLGQDAKSATDAAAARRLDAKVEARFVRWGLSL